MPSRSGSSQMTVMEDTSLDRLAAVQLSKLLVLAPPWALLLVCIAVAALFHRLWPQIWAASGVGVFGALLSLLTWHVSRQRGHLGRWHAACTVLAACWWIAAAARLGPTWPALGYLWAVGGAAVALSWNIRAVIRAQHHDGDGDPLARIFAGVAVDAGIGRSRLQVKDRSPQVVEAVILLPAGEKTADDVIKKAPYLESGLKLPPGSLQIAPDMDRADQALMKITDPRAIRRPQPWEGPSRPGASIAEPVCPGNWQDGTPVAYTAAGHHLMVMGMTGAAKSTGAGYSLLGEIVTRRDAAVFAIDVTKGDQTLGAWRPALHGLVTDKDKAKAHLAALKSAIKPRTDYLAAKGLQNWEDGCGLTYLVVWLEEAPDIFEALGDKGLKDWLAALKAARSAGIEYVVSLQRADWSQMPTIARGQLARLCMGVADSDDASFGLSDLQQERNCRPELWQARQPGMAYIDAPSIPEDRISMPWRTWYWGRDDKAARAHAAAYPASGRPLDELTARILGEAVSAPPEPEEDEDPIREYSTEEDDEVDDDGDTIEAPDPGSEFGGWKFGAEPGRMAPDKARELFRGILAGWAGEGREWFAMADLAELGLRERTGMSRPWVYKQLDLAADDGLIERDEEVSGRWLLVKS